MESYLTPFSFRGGNMKRDYGYNNYYGYVAPVDGRRLVFATEAEYEEYLDELESEENNYGEFDER